MSRSLCVTFPVRSPALTMEMVGMDVCPQCGGPLDTGKTCTKCASTWWAMVPARYKWTPSGEKSK